MDPALTCPAPALLMVPGGLLLSAVQPNLTIFAAAWYAGLYKTTSVCSGRCLIHIFSYRARNSTSGVLQQLISL